MNLSFVQSFNNNIRYEKRGLEKSYENRLINLNFNVNYSWCILNVVDNFQYKYTETEIKNYL